MPDTQKPPERWAAGGSECVLLGGERSKNSPLSCAEQDAIAILYHGRRVGQVIPRRHGFEAIVLHGQVENRGRYNHQIDAANAVLRAVRGIGQ